MTERTPAPPPGLLPRTRPAEPDVGLRLYDRFADRIHDFVLFLTRDPGMAAETTRDVIVMTAQQRVASAETATLRAWLYAQARTEVFALLSTRGRTPAEDRVVEVPELPDPPTPADLGQVVWAAMAAFSERDQALVTLHLRHGLDGPALADAMGLSAGAVEVLLAPTLERVEQQVAALLALATDRLPEGAAADLLEARDSWDGRFSPMVRGRVSRLLADCGGCPDDGIPGPLALLQAVPLAPAPGSLREAVADRLALTWRLGGGVLGTGPDSAEHTVPPPGAAAAGGVGAAEDATIPPPPPASPLPTPSHPSTGLGGQGEDVTIPPGAGPPAAAAPGGTASSGPLASGPLISGPLAGGSPASGPIPPVPAAASPTAAGGRVAGASPSGTAGTAAPPAADPSASGPLPTPTGRGARPQPRLPLPLALALGVAVGLVAAAGLLRILSDERPSSAATGTAAPTEVVAPLEGVADPLTGAASAALPAPTGPATSGRLTLPAEEVVVTDEGTAVALGNSGGTPVTWQVVDQPAWAVVDRVQGEVEPGARVELAVSLAEGLAEGDHTGGLLIRWEADGQSGTSEARLAAAVERPPDLQQLQVSSRDLVTAGCGQGYTETRVTVVLADESPVAEVLVTASAAGVQTQVALPPDPAAPGRYVGVIGPFDAAGTLTMAVEATDARGNRSGADAGVLVVHPC